MTRFALVLGLVSAGCGVLATRSALADPQATLGVTAGAALEDVAGPRPLGGAFHLGGRADVLLLGSRPGAMAIGPYADVATAGFKNVDVGGGGSWLLPWVEEVPFVLSAGVFARSGEGRAAAPGVEGTFFAGSRNYNFHSWYGLAAGLFAQARWVPVAPGELDLVVGLQIDAELLALPWMLAFEGLRHM